MYKNSQSTRKETIIVNFFLILHSNSEKLDSEHSGLDIMKNPFFKVKVLKCLIWNFFFFEVPRVFAVLNKIVVHGLLWNNN